MDISFQIHKEKIIYNPQISVNSNKNNNYLIFFQVESNYFYIEARKKDDFFNKVYSNKFSLEKIRENKYFSDFVDLKKINDEIKEIIKIKETTIFEDESKLILSISLPYVKVKEIKFDLILEKKNVRVIFNEISDILMALKQDINELKSKNNELKLENNELKNINECQEKAIKFLSESIKTDVKELNQKSLEQSKEINELRLFNINQEKEKEKKEPEENYSDIKMKVNKNENEIILLKEKIFIFEDALNEISQITLMNNKDLSELVKTSSNKINSTKKSYGFEIIEKDDIITLNRKENKKKEKKINENNKINYYKININNKINENNKININNKINENYKINENNKINENKINENYKINENNKINENKINENYKINENKINENKINENYKINENKINENNKINQSNQINLILENKINENNKLKPFLSHEIKNIDKERKNNTLNNKIPFLFNNNLNYLTEIYNVSKNPLPSKFKAILNFTSVSSIRIGISLDKDIIKDKIDKNKPLYNIYYISEDLNQFYDLDNGWRINVFKWDGEKLKKGDNLAIIFIDGNLSYSVNGKKLEGSVKVKEYDKKEIYLLIHRRNNESNVQIISIEEI